MKRTQPWYAISVYTLPIVLFCLYLLAMEGIRPESFIAPGACFLLVVALLFGELWLLEQGDEEPSNVFSQVANSLGSGWSVPLEGFAVWSLLVAAWGWHWMGKRQRLEKSLRPPELKLLSVNPRAAIPLVKEHHLQEMQVLIQNRVVSSSVSYAQLTQGTAYLFTATEDSMLVEENQGRWTKAIIKIANRASRKRTAA